MQGTKAERPGRRAAVLAAALGALVVGCASRTSIHFDEGEDFSGYRTWDWLPGAATLVDAPPDERSRLDARLTRAVARELDALGFERSLESPDFFVTGELRLYRQLVILTETPAVQQLSSMHSSPSFEIQATRSERAVYEDVDLLIRVVGTQHRERTLWRGHFEGRFRGGFAPRLGDAVAELLERFPPPPRTEAAAPRSRARETPAPGRPERASPATW